MEGRRNGRSSKWKVVVMGCRRNGSSPKCEVVVMGSRDCLSFMSRHWHNLSFMSRHWHNLSFVMEGRRNGDSS